MTRLAWVDRAKGIAILMVVLHHVIQFSADLRWASDDVIYCNTMLQTFRMPLFFAMSGLFFRGAASASWRWLMVNRVLPFLYLYGIWTAIWNAVFELTPFEGINFGLRHAPSLVTDPGVGPWYIFALALYFVVAKVLSPLPSWGQLAIVAAVSARRDAPHRDGLGMAIHQHVRPGLLRGHARPAPAHATGQPDHVGHSGDRRGGVGLRHGGGVPAGMAVRPVPLRSAMRGRDRPWCHARRSFGPGDLPGLVRQADSADLPAAPTPDRCRVLD